MVGQRYEKTLTRNRGMISVYEGMGVLAVNGLCVYDKIRILLGRLIKIMNDIVGFVIYRYLAFE